MVLVENIEENVQNHRHKRCKAAEDGRRNYYLLGQPYKPGSRTDEIVGATLEVAVFANEMSKLYSPDADGDV